MNNNPNPNVPNQYPFSGTKKSGAGQIAVFVVIALLIIVLSVVLIFVLKKNQSNDTIVDPDWPPPPPQMMETQVTVNGSNTQFGYYTDEDMRYISLTGFFNYVGFTYKVDGDVYTITPLKGGDTKLNIKNKKVERTNESGEKVEAELSELELYNTGEVFILAKELTVLFENILTEYIPETGKTNITVPGFTAPQPQMGQQPMMMSAQNGEQPQTQQPAPANNAPADGQQTPAPAGNQQPPQGNAPEGQPQNN